MPDVPHFAVRSHAHAGAPTLDCLMCSTLHGWLTSPPFELPCVAISCPSCCVSTAHSIRPPSLQGSPMSRRRGCVNGIVEPIYVSMGGQASLHTREEPRRSIAHTLCTRDRSIAHASMLLWALGRSVGLASWHSACTSPSTSQDEERWPRLSELCVQPAACA